MNRQEPKLSTWCGSLRIEQRDHDSQTTMDVRRVETSGDGEHIQIAVTVDRFHPKRTVSQHGYLQLRPEDIPFLVTALTKLHPKYDQTRGYVSFADHDRETRQFYGLSQIAN